MIVGYFMQRNGKHSLLHFNNSLSSTKRTADLMHSIEKTLPELNQSHSEDTRDQRLLIFQEIENKQKHTDNASFLLAKSLFNLKEYHRVAHILSSKPKPPRKRLNRSTLSTLNESSVIEQEEDAEDTADDPSRRSIFLRRYSLFLVGEKRKEEEVNEFQMHCPVINCELQNLREELHSSLFPSTSIDFSLNQSQPDSSLPPSHHPSSLSDHSFSTNQSEQFNRFLNQSISQLINQSSDQSEPSVDELSIHNQSLEPSFDSSSIEQSADPPVDQSTNLSISPQQSPSFDQQQLVSDSINQSTNGSVNQSTMHCNRII